MTSHRFVLSTERSDRAAARERARPAVRAHAARHDLNLRGDLPGAAAAAVGHPRAPDILLNGHHFSQIRCSIKQISIASKYGLKNEVPPKPPADAITNCLL